MKRIIILISIILVVIVLAIYCYFVNYGWTYLDVENSNIISLKLVEETEAGTRVYYTEDSKLIYEVVSALNNIKVKEKTNIRVTDSTRTYIIKFKDKEERYVFEDIYMNVDGINYNIENYNKLKNIEIPIKE